MTLRALMDRLARTASAFVAALLASGCEGVQSALAPQGPQAERAAFLYWLMTIGGGVIFIVVMLLTGLALFARPSWRGWMARESIVIGAGVIFPITLLSALLVYGFAMMGSTPRALDADPIKISVEGLRWWWRVTYQDRNGQTIESANELRLPAGLPVELALTSPDVIHSFWVPKLAGKLDMIPGRTTVLTLTAHDIGVMRGQCAEYCGGAHALMSFNVVVAAPAEFQAWLTREAAPAPETTGPVARDGRAQFFAGGCHACHTIRGVSEASRIGPDLTHIGARSSIGAATLAADKDSIARWIRDNQHIKPGNLMPAYGIFTPAQLDALATYLASLR